MLVTFTNASDSMLFNNSLESLQYYGEQGGWHGSTLNGTPDLESYIREELREVTEKELIEHGIPL